MLGEFVAMPNHVHGIVIIDKPMRTNVQMQNIVQTQNIVETQNIASLPPTGNKFGPQSQNLASIVRGFKIGITKFARQHQIEFGWQDRYHDHIIRNDAEYQRICNYIIANPSKWETDKFHSR